MKRHQWLILILLVLGFGLRVWNLAGQSFWWDEAFTWQTTSHGTANLWQMLLTGDRNPPLYFASVAVWGSVAGWSEFSLRFVSVCWMMIGLSFLYNLAKRLYNTLAGLWTLALAAVAPALVIYAQEARMYAAFFALTVATLYFAWRVFEISGQQSAVSSQQSVVSSRKEVLAFLLCEAGLLLTHYFALPLVATVNLFALIVLLRRRAGFTAYAKWIGGQLLAMLPIMIWTLIVFSTPGSLINAQEVPPSVFSFLDQVVTLWFVSVRALEGGGGLLLFALLILLVSLLSAWHVNRRSTCLLAIFVGVSLVVAYAMTLLLTSFHPRYVLAFSSPVFALLGAALFNLSDDRSAVIRVHVDAAVIFLVAMGLLTIWLTALSPITAKDNARGVAEHLKHLAAADAVILQEANDYTLNYYDHGPAQTRMITATTELAALAQLNDAVKTAKQVWLPHWTVSTQDPRGYWPFLLEQAGSLRWRPEFHGYDLRKYELSEPIQAPSLALTVDSNGSLKRWSGVEGQGADGALTFAIEWQPPVKLYDTAGVSARLLDSHGTTISSVDRALLDEQGRTTGQWPMNQSVVNYYVLPIPPGTPPLTYTLTAQLYTDREVLTNQVLATLSLPRQSDITDPYHTLDGYHFWRNPSGPQELLPGVQLEAVGDLSRQHGVQPQEQIEMVLQWRKVSAGTAVKPRLRLIQNNRVVAEFGSPLFERDYPIEQWEGGERVIDRVKFNYPPLRGETYLQVGLDDRWTRVGDFQLDESALLFNPPALQHTHAAQFADFAELLGYDLESDSLSSARPLNLTLYWRATNTEPLTTSYTVFTQILASDGHLVAQADAPPRPPTVQWVPGQIVVDYHAIKVVDPAYRGPATLIVGWYNSATIERVSVNSGGDHVMLQAPVRVEDQ